MPPPALHIQPIPTGPFLENCFLVGDPGSKAAVIIDPGYDADRIFAAVADGEWQVAMILQTHGHVDHIAAAADVKETLGVSIHMHPADKMYLPTLVADAAGYGMPDVRVPEIDHDLTDGQIIDWPGGEIEVIHTPGHTPGHVIFRFGDDVICGDLVFAGSIGRTDLPGGDYDLMFKSLGDKLLSLPPHLQLHPGHGPSTILAIEKHVNQFLIGHPANHR